MSKCVICGKEIESGNICEKCYNNDDDDFAEYLPEYGDNYGTRNGVVYVNAKFLLNESHNSKNTYMIIDADDVELDFATAIKRALELIEEENLQCAYIYSSDFKGFKVTKPYFRIEEFHLLTDYANTLKRLVFSLEDTIITPDAVLKNDFKVSKLPPEDFYKYEDYLSWKKHL